MDRHNNNRNRGRVLPIDAVPSSPFFSRLLFSSFGWLHGRLAAAALSIEES
jgi:hypothetical protein